MTRRQTKTTRPGSVLPLVAICTTALMGFIAMAVDIGVITVARNQCQNAADSAAMAGARTITGDSSTTYNIASVPGQAITTATQNQVLGQTISGDPANPTKPNSYTYTTGQVTVQVGAYAYVFNDAQPSKEGFQLLIPNTVSNEPYSACLATITYSGSFSFAKVWGLSGFNTSATSVAAHRPRDTMIIVDLSGSMRFQSIPGSAQLTYDMFGNTGTYNLVNGYYPRTVSMNPDTAFPKFGPYSDTTSAALKGTTSYQNYTGEMTDPNNISSTQDCGPPICADFYSNAVGTAASSSNVAFTSAASTYATAPGGDDPLHVSVDTTASGYAQTINGFLSSSALATKYLDWENYGYLTTNYANPTAGSSRTAFNGYTQGPSYWGKTFFIWPPPPTTTSSATFPIQVGSALPSVTNPSSITDTSFNWYSWGGLWPNDWRKRFFVAVNTSDGKPYLVQHDNVLFNSSATSDGASPFLNTPNSDTTTVTENGSSVTYKYYINYSAILYWLSQSPVTFPSTLQGGRIRYYTTRPSGTDNALNNRWWTTNPTSLSHDEHFWKDYIDYVLGFYSTSANSYSSTQYGVNYSALIGNGDWFQWASSTIQIKQRGYGTNTTINCPSASNPWAPYQSGTINHSGGYSGTTSSPTTSVAVSGLSNFSYDTVSGSNVTRDFIYFVDKTTNKVKSGPHAITSAYNTTSPLTLSPGVTVSLSNGDYVKVFAPWMPYDECPYRPAHHFWFGPMTFVDWLGNYNLVTTECTPHHWWPGNVHEAHCWACKAGVQTAIADIKNNHPNDYVGLTFFSTPNYAVSGTGHHNRAVVPLGRSYQQMTDSLWFPPTTVTGSATEISPYDTDMSQVPRANGGTAPEMGFMIAYNQFSSSTTNLRFYSKPSAQLPSTSSPNYRGTAGGLGRKGAARLIIFETDGFPNTKADASIVSSGSDSYYPIRLYNPEDMTDNNNVEWPSGGSYADSDVFTVVQQIVASTTATTPGFSTTRRPALVHCVGYGSIFDPSFSGTAQTNALTFLQTVQYNGNTSSDTDPTHFPSYKRIYGKATDRVTLMQTAFKTIMQSGVQVSLIR